jgi:hypothetical protein
VAAGKKVEMGRDKRGLGLKTGRWFRKKGRS